MKSQWKNCSTSTAEAIACFWNLDWALARRGTDQSGHVGVITFLCVSVLKLLKSSMFLPWSVVVRVRYGNQACLYLQWGNVSNAGIPGAFPDSLCLPDASSAELSWVWALSMLEMCSGYSVGPL